jgi:hypothetical protein
MERDGVAPPQVLTEQPRLPVGLVMYLEAFYELDTERVHTVTMHGMSVARIPWSRIVGYGQHYGYDVDELLFFIRKMDDAHLEQLASRQGGSGGGSPGTREVVQRPPRPD